MMSRKWIARMFVAAAVVLGLSAGKAEAGLLPVSVTVQPEGGNFSWTYSVVLPTNMSLQSGAYFTIYDFAGYIPKSATVSAQYSGGPGSTSTSIGSWGVSVTNTGVTPPHLNPVVNPNYPSLTFTYTGPTIPSGQLTLGNFTAMSTYSGSTTGYFTATNVRAVDGQTDANITSTLVPNPRTGGAPPGVPEPTTLALAGLGLPFLGLARRLRRKA
jgi:hypothetical protein